MQLHESTVRQDARTPRHQDEGWLGHGRRGDVLVAPEQECNRPHTQRRRKRRRENANEIPLTPLYHILSPGPHRANTLHYCYELGGFPERCALARRPAARQQKGAVSRREPRAIGSRRVFLAVPHDRHHLSKPLKRRCGQQKPETSLHLKAIMRGAPREKARSEPVVSAPPTPRRCPSAARRCLPRRCLAAYPSFEILLYYQQLSGIEPRGGGGRNESR